MEGEGAHLPLPASRPSFTLDRIGSVREHLLPGGEKDRRLGRRLQGEPKGATEETKPKLNGVYATKKT